MPRPMPPSLVACRSYSAVCTAFSKWSVRRHPSRPHSRRVGFRARPMATILSMSSTQTSVSRVELQQRAVDDDLVIAMYITTNVSASCVVGSVYDRVCRDKEHLGKRRPSHTHSPLWLPFRYGPCHLWSS